MTLKNILVWALKLICLIPIFISFVVLLYSAFKVSCDKEGFNFFYFFLFPSVVAAVGLIWQFHHRIKPWPLVIMLVLSLVVGSVLLASLNAARSKSPNGTVMAAVANIRSAAEVYYEQNNYSYVNMCTESEDVSSLLAVVEDNAISYRDKCRGWFWKLIIPITHKSSGTVSAVCQSSDSAYVISAELPERYRPDFKTQYWCVDSTGFASQKTSGNIDGMVCSKSYEN